MIMAKKKAKAAKKARKTRARRPVKRAAKRVARKAAPKRKAAARRRAAPKKAAAKPAMGMGMPAARPAAPAMGMGMAPATRFKADHTVVSGDTLTLIALKYYGPGAHDKWRVIYDANKGVIGDNPYLLKPGMVLRIPEI
jgi:nucleoid-associated protein YgaU